MNHLTFKFVLCAIGLIGGVFMLVAPFIPRTKACSSRHHRLALFFCGLAVVAWAALGLNEQLSYPGLASTALDRLHHFKGMCAGAALGILLLQFASGEFIAAYRKDKLLRTSSTNAKPS